MKNFTIEWARILEFDWSVGNKRPADVKLVNLTENNGKVRGYESIFSGKLKFKRQNKKILK